MASQPVKSLEVKILSYNIRHGEDRNGESNLRDIIKIINEEKPQLVAFQATDSLLIGGKLHFQLRQLAAQVGMYYMYAAEEKSENGSQGVGLMSVWPFEKTQRMELPHSPGADTRVLLCGLLKLPNEVYFRFCTSRLEYAAVYDRALQAAYINRVLEESIQPVILAMDMGARPNEQPYFSFRKRWVDVARGSLLPTWTEGVAGDRLDYIMLLENKRLRAKNYRVIRNYPNTSDHFPISAVVEFW
jgi:endonuclease/exonuclease/phosphatase family metal-dependent hydrolase